MTDILLVEDNEELSGLTQLFLKKAGYSVHAVMDGEAAVEYIENNSGKLRLVLLDIMLPGIDGFAVCRAVRKKGSTPIIILSARTGKDDKLKGYDLGADDYIEKPFDMDILIAKIAALINRNGHIESEKNYIVSGEITVDLSSHKVTLAGNTINLSIKEYELLVLFIKNPEKVLDKNFIFDTIWGSYSESENQTLTVHIKTLRDKIEVDKKNPKRIQTVWGVGYRYEEI